MPRLPFIFSLLLLQRLLEFTLAFTPSIFGIGALLFPVKKTIERVSQSPSRRQDLALAGDFFVDAFWTKKVGGGATQLSPKQKRSLEQSQAAEFTSRYGGRRFSELFLCRDEKGDIIACAGIEVVSIPSGSLNGIVDKRAPLMSNLAVSRQYRRRGLAEAMVRAVEAFIQDEWDYNECYLYVERRNLAAIKLYEKMGYRTLWTDPDAKTLMPTKDGELRTQGTVMICMKKSLKAGNALSRLFG